jgi:hypothetical protein
MPAAAFDAPRLLVRGTRLVNAREARIIRTLVVSSPEISTRESRQKFPRCDCNPFAYNASNDAVAIRFHPNFTTNAGKLGLKKTRSGSQERERHELVAIFCVLSGVRDASRSSRGRNGPSSTQDTRERDSAISSVKGRETYVHSRKQMDRAKVIGFKEASSQCL